MKKVNYNGSDKTIKRLCEGLAELKEHDDKRIASVLVQALISSGVNIATITVNGTPVTIKAPAGGDGAIFIDTEGYISVDYDLIRREEVVDDDG